MKHRIADDIADVIREDIDSAITSDKNSIDIHIKIREGKYTIYERSVKEESING